jgi:hypothetical protein
MDRLHRVAVELQIDRVWLKSEPDNTAALRLWTAWVPKPGGRPRSGRRADHG